MAPSRPVGHSCTSYRMCAALSTCIAFNIQFQFGTSHDESTWLDLHPDKSADFNFIRQHTKVRNYQHKMDRIWLKEKRFNFFSTFKSRLSFSKRLWSSVKGFEGSKKSNKTVEGINVL